MAFSHLALALLGCLSVAEAFLPAAPLLSTPARLQASSARRRVGAPLTIFAQSGKGGKKKFTEADKEVKPADVLLKENREQLDQRDAERRPRAARRAAQRKGSGISGDLRFKLLEEQAAPFRKFRQFFYIAAAGSASIGMFISGSRIAAALSGIEGVQPLSETVPNTLINLGVVATGVGLWIWEDRRGKESIDKISEKSGIKKQMGELPVELSDGSLSTLTGIRDKYRGILLAGTASEVTRSINLASRVGDDLTKNGMLVVPFFTDLEDDSAGWTAMKESSPDGKWDPFLARPVNRDAWKEWLLAEKQQVAEKNKENAANIDTKAFDKLLRVFILRLDGKVGARTVGPPAWPKLVKQIESLPARDQYGTP